MSGPALPFRTTTVRSTSESSMNSFINSMINSSFSAAEKSKSSLSASTSIKVSALFASFNASSQGATEGESESHEASTSTSNTNVQKQETGTEAFVSEYTFVPTKSISLREGGLILSDYAYHRLKQVRNAATAKEFLKAFGTHIPMGNQTLGGVFIRTMKMTSRKETKMSELFSAATVELSKTNKEAMKATASGGFKHGFIGAIKGSASASISSASSSGFTSTGDAAYGSGDASGSSNATFESNVICHGPNAATHDSFYQQLMTNNATWTVIDRGEPTSYFAVWDLIDYMGQGDYFSRQCDLLKAEWKSMALKNMQANPGDAELLAELWTFGPLEPVLEVSKFLSNLASCLVPVDMGTFDSNLANQFESVVKLAALAAKEDPSVTFSPKEFIEAGSAGTEKLKFSVFENCPEYEVTKALMSSFTPSHWSCFDLAFTETVKNAVISLGKRDRLFNLCKRYFNSDEDDWSLCKKLIEFPAEYVKADDKEKEAYTRHLKEQLEMRDKEGLTCAQYLTKSDNFELFKCAIVLGPSSLIPDGGKDIVDYALAHGNGSIQKFIDSITLVDITGKRTSEYNTTTIEFGGSFEINSIIPINPYYKGDSCVYVTKIVVKKGEEVIWYKMFNDEKYEKGISVTLDHGIVGSTVAVHARLSSSRSNFGGSWGQPASWAGSSSGNNSSSSSGNNSSSIPRANIHPQVMTRSLRNVALGKKATQSTTVTYCPASRAVDGDLLHLPEGTGSYTIEEGFPWWEVDLDGTFDIHAIRIYPRGDKVEADYQLNHLTVEVFKDGSKEAVWKEYYEGAPFMSKDHTFKLPGGKVGNRVKISKNNVKGYGYICMNQVQVFAKVTGDSVTDA
uniref:Fucolectin tachylectin-4 pentraxin-1 domain-containing protein n=1 Tax=Ditylum brightwellii TaxID=49249 RepID=A0A7S4S2X3_9STRA